MGWMDEFIRGFLRGAGEELSLIPREVVLVRRAFRRPKRSEIQTYVSESANRIMFHRLDVLYRGEAYHVMYAYINSAIYTVTYDRKLKRNPKYKVLSVLNGRASVREVMEALHFALKERKRVASREATRWGLKQQRRNRG